MPKILLLPPNTEGIAEDDLFGMHNKSATTTEKATAKQVREFVEWSPATGWAYSSWSATTRIGVASVPAGALTKYMPGMRVRFSQTTGGTKYGIIVEVTDDTTLTIFFPDGTTFNNETVSSPHFSNVKIPFGFDADPDIWSLHYSAPGGEDETAGLTAYQQLGSALLTIGKGAWLISSRAYVEWRYSNAIQDFEVALSTSQTSVSDSEMYTRDYDNNTNTGAATCQKQYVYGKPIKLSAQVDYYIIGRIANGGTEIDLRAASWIKAICAYL